jgi:hypothetical protein
MFSRNKNTSWVYVGEASKLIKLSLIFKERTYIMNDFFNNKTLLITGGTGSFGNAVMKRFLDTDIKEIRIFSRDEKKQDDMRKYYKNDKLKFYIGDVRDIQSVRNALHGVDYIFHAAALKQVPSCEFFPLEAVKTNVLGTDNVLTADINLTYSDIAREYLLREGLPADRVIKTGSPMFEVLNSRKDDIEKSDVLERLGLETEKYFVVSAHREENISSEQNFMDLVDSLNIIAEKYNMPLIVSTHPRTRKMIEAKGIEFNPLVRTMKPLGFNDYVKLQKYAKAVLSDSGTISEESSILGFRALNIRQAHERPEAMEEASVMMVGLKKERILQGLEVLETQEKGTLRLVEDYSMPNVSDKVLRIILSFTDYVNRVVWGKGGQ